MTGQIIVPSFLSLIFVYAFLGRMAFNIGFAVWVGALGGFIAGQEYLERVDPKKNFKSFNFAVPALLTFMTITLSILYFFNIQRPSQSWFQS